MEYTALSDAEQAAVWHENWDWTASLQIWLL